MVDRQGEDIGGFRIAGEAVYRNCVKGEELGEIIQNDIVMEPQ